MAKCNSVKEQAVQAQDFESALSAEASVSQAKTLRIPKNLSKAAIPLGKRIDELLSVYDSEAQATKKQMSVATTASNYREAQRLKDGLQTSGRETCKRVVSIYLQAVISGGSTEAFKYIWEKLTKSIPADIIDGMRENAESSKPKSRGWGAVQKAVRKPAKKVAQEAMVDVLKRLNKPPKRSADKFASQDELNNCTFNLDLKSVRASVVTTKRTEGKWQPPAKGWKPGNAPLTSRQSQDGLQSIRSRAVVHQNTCNLGASSRSLGASSLSNR